MNVSSRVIKNSSAAGIVGGIAFGLMMTMGGKMPMIASLVDSQSVLIGWLVHLMISVVTGVIFGIFYDKLIHNTKNGAIYGMIYGFIWWLLGPLTLMPLALGMGVQWNMAAMQANIPSLFGHVILFGLILGIVYAKLKQSR